MKTIILLLIIGLIAFAALGAELPDSTLTPGATDARVTQANIHTTICVKGYTATVRPPQAYTETLKRNQLAKGPYSVGAVKSLAAYEEDHLIPLCAGGNPKDVKNLWPQPREFKTRATHGAALKDACEVHVCQLVCKGGATLADAQHGLATDWIAYCSTFKGEGQ